MNGIFEILSAIADAIVAVFDFVVSFFMDLVYIVQLFAMFLVQIPSFFSWIPSQLASILVVGISVAVIFKIAGRN